MDKYKYLIIGGGVAGTTAAETIRKNDPTGSIAIVSDEPYRFYSRIMLSKPNFFLGKIPLDSVWLRTEAWYEQNKITLISGKSAAGLSPQEKVVTLTDGSKLAYEKLLLALGSKANRWPGEGGGLAGVYSLRGLDDAKAIIAAIKMAKQVVVVGGGFVGFEMAELVRMAGLPAVMLIRERYFWDFLWDETSGRMLESALKLGGVEVLDRVSVDKIEGRDKVEAVVLKNGARVPADMVIVGIGVNYPLAWLAGSGLNIGRGILADEFLQTNLPDIWTAGDVAEYQDIILGERVMLGNWVNAQQHGRTAGMNMTGEKKAFKFVSFYTTQGFGISIAFVGNVAPVVGREVIHRGSAEINSYCRLLVQDGCLVGATMINRTKELGLISKLIETKVNISDKRIALADSDFDLKEIVDSKQL